MENLGNYDGYARKADWGRSERLHVMESATALASHHGEVKRFGSIAPWSVPAGLLSARIIPTRPVDVLTRRIVGRPLATVLKIATIWGLTFVIGIRPDRSLVVA